MPSSPTFHDYTRTLQRFFYRGIQLTPQDALAEGKVAFARNIRSYQEGTISPRYGMDLISDPAFSDPIHSIFRLVDTTPYAIDSDRRILGVGTGIYGGSPAGTTYGLIEPGLYSGNPLTAVSSSPAQSPRPWLYIADSLRMRKVNSDLNDAPIGIAPPPNPPEAALTVPGVYYNGGVIPGTNWVAYGTFATMPVVATDRINALVTTLLYDEGSTGMASVALDDFFGVTPGATVQIGLGGETVQVHEVFPAIGSTTIAAIIYDAGTTGLCTIQPTGSFSIGQIEAAVPAEIRRRYEQLDEPAPPGVTVNRTVDFPVNALVLINGVEVVRILSVALGPDGTQSFRCFTFGTFAAGDALTGMASFRAFFQTTRAAGDTAIDPAMENVITPPTTDAYAGGVQQASLGGNLDWSTIGIVVRATQPDDIIRVGIKISDLAFVKSVRFLLDVDPGAGLGTFLTNYYFYEWRANDLISAIQQSSPLAAGLMADAQAGAVDQGQVDTEYQNQYGSDPVGGVVLNRNGDPTPEHILEARRRRSLIFPQQTPPRTDGFVTAGSAASRQLILGNNQWIVLHCRVRDLTRVGSRSDMTLANINSSAVVVTIEGSTDPVTVAYSNQYLTGGFGPDCGPTLPPYVYRYRYRSTITGERSNPSPTMRAGVTPRRQRVALEADPSTHPLCDSVDWFRFGGALARWTYVGTSPNDAAASPPISDFNDDMADRQIDGGESLDFRNFQPWPTYDLPRSGTCNVAGTAVTWVSGDTFDTTWAPNTIIIVNGRATSLYQSPQTTTFLEVIDNCESGTAVEFSIPAPLFLGQALPAMWGGPIGNAWFHFAVGDPSDPAALHWTNGNDPDSTSDRNILTVTSASEPLQNGCFLDGTPYVFTTERMLRIVPTFGGLSDFQTVETPCTEGLWSRWAMAVADDGVYFLAKDGVRFTSGGPSKSVMDPDLRILFPQDGASAEPIRGLYPVDMTQTTRLKLTMVDQTLYFDYADTLGNGATLVYEPMYDRWTPDVYLESEDSPPVAQGITARLSEPGPQIHDHILGGEDGNLYQYTINKITDVLLDINWAVWTVWAHGGDPRAYKQWGDAILDMNPGRSINGILVTPVVDNGNIALTQQTLGAGGGVRDTFLVEVGTGGELGYGVLSRNCGLWIEGAVQACDIQRPILYLWEPSFLHKQVSVAFRATDWEDLGYKGAKFVQGVVIRANTFGLVKLVEVQYDGVNAAPPVALTLMLNHDGERQLAYPLAAAGWTPFVGELVRLQGADTKEWILLDWRWVWEPAPELATQWETQYTTFGYPGFLDVHDGIVAYQSTAPVTWFIEYQDGSSGSYVLPSSAGLYRRLRQITMAQKGKAVRFRWTSDEPFRLFKNDCSVRVQPWGIGGGYQLQNPFGGPHYADGAGI